MELGINRRVNKAKWVMRTGEQSLRRYSARFLGRVEKTTAIARRDQRSKPS